MTNKYILFAGEDHYPCGGARDYQMSSDNIEDCKLFFEQRDTSQLYCPEWAHIIDRDTFEIVVYGADADDGLNTTVWGKDKDWLL